MIMMLTRYGAFVTRTKLEVEIKCLFSRVIVIVAIDKQLNELAATRAQRAKIAI